MSCIEKIKKEFADDPNKEVEDVYNENNGQKVEITDENFLKLVDEKLSYIQSTYIDKKESESQIDDKDNVKKSKRKKVHQKEKEEVIKVIKKEKRPKKISRRFRILKENLMLITNNGMTVKQFMNHNPFQTKPFELANSYEFLEAVKYERLTDVHYFLNNPNLLFSFDYYRQTAFHWAAKKNLLETCRMLLSFDNCVNQVDVNHMTPLAFAALNNNYDMCVLLCENGANPLIPNDENQIPMNLTKDLNIKAYLFNLGETNFKHHI